MQVRHEIDATALTRFPKYKHPLYFGVSVLITIEASVVAVLLASYFYLGFAAPDWPPVPPQPLLLPTVNLGLLLASAALMFWGSRAIARGNQRVLAITVTLAVLLDCVVLLLRFIQFHRFTVRWDGSAYGSLLWTITGFHFVHVTSAIVGSAVIAGFAWAGYFTEKRQLGVIVDTLYWYFVSLIWLPLWFVLYIVPRL